MSRAWTFVSVLTVCAAYFGRLGDARECELATYKASQILQHFIAHSPQAKQYDLILKKLSRVALGCINASEDQLHSNGGLLWFDLFRLTPAHLYHLKEEEISLNTSTSAQNRLVTSEGNHAIPLNVDQLQQATHLNPSDNIFNFPDEAYKEFYSYILMPEGLLFEPESFF